MKSHKLRVACTRNPKYEVSQRTFLWPGKRFSEQTAARKQMSHNLHLIRLLHLLETDLQDLHPSRHALRQVPESLLQLVEQPQQLPALLRGQVLGVLRDKELDVKGSGVQLRLGVCKGLFQLLNGREKTRRAKRLGSQRFPALPASHGTRRQAAACTQKKVVCHQNNIFQKSQMVPKAHSEWRGHLTTAVFQRSSAPGCHHLTEGLVRPCVPGCPRV